MSGTKGTETRKRDYQQELAEPCERRLAESSQSKCGDTTSFGHAVECRGLAMNLIRINSRLDVALLLKAAAATGILLFGLAVPFLGILWEIGVIGR